MQAKKRKIILKSIAKTTKRLRGDKSQYLLGLEYDISSSILSMLERGEKDPQLTTLFKLAEAFNLTISEFMVELEKELPSDFSVYDD